MPANHYYIPYYMPLQLKLSSHLLEKKILQAKNIIKKFTGIKGYFYLKKKDIRL